MVRHRHPVAGGGALPRGRRLSGKFIAGMIGGYAKGMPPNAPNMVEIRQPISRRSHTPFE